MCQMQRMFKAYAISKSRSYTDATIPAMDFPEMLYLPEDFYIGLAPTHSMELFK